MKGFSVKSWAISILYTLAVLSFISIPFKYYIWGLSVSVLGIIVGGSLKRDADLPMLQRAAEILEERQREQR